MKYGVIIKNSGLRDYIPMPITYFPGFTAYKFQERRCAKTEMRFCCSIKKFVLITPKVEPVTLDDDVNEYMKAYFSVDNTVQIKIYSVDFQNMSFGIFKDLKVDFSYKDLF
jgi:hypothetical protein